MTRTDCPDCGEEPSTEYDNAARELHVKGKVSHVTGEIRGPICSRLSRLNRRETMIQRRMQDQSLTATDSL